MIEKWECYLCAKEFSFDKKVSGFLGNYHPLCRNCSDKCISENNIQTQRLTYHYQYGEVRLLNKVPIPKNKFNEN